jgi:hypothetical protein
MIDAEFNLDRRLLTWVDTVSGDVWVAAYDFETGQFLPADGRGVLIEAAVSTGGDYPGLGFTVNGPEWALGNHSDAIVYTRNNAPGDPTRGNALIGVATLGADGTWTRQTLATPRRNGPYGSLNRNDDAMVSYQDALGNQFVRRLREGSAEVPLPGFASPGLAPPTVRFADSANLVAYQALFDGVAQSVAFDLDTQVLTQLTFDSTAKDQSWMWSAPEFDGALALVNNVGKSTITLYRPEVDGAGDTVYRVHASVAAPRGGKWFSLEPFVYQGRSYVIAQYTPRGLRHPASIWLVGFDPANPVLRQVTPDGLRTEARADPEVLPTAQGVLVLYSKFDTTKCTPANTSTWLCMQALEGMFRADTGLPAPN